MDVRFVGQPHEVAANLADFLAEVLVDVTTNRLRVVTAWAKRSGLGRMRDVMRAYRDRGGRSAIILGIDEEGATIQGLHLAVELFDTVHVFHEAGATTFHPKVYLADGDGSARLFVGSNNFTAGGLYGNYEAALDCRLDLAVTPDQEFLAQVNAYIDRLYNDEEVCRPLTRELLDHLVADDRYRIQDEDYRPERHDEVQEREDLEAGEEPPRDLFGASREAKRRGPPLPLDLLPQRRPARRPRPIPARATAVGVESGEAARRWFKKLNPTDAQHPPTATSSPTGNLRLSQARLPIDHRTYFRREFFEGAVWATEPTAAGQLEVTIVPFDVEINDEAYGELGIRVDHAPYREAGQNNVPTVLKWGELNAILREHDLTGEYVVLERRQDGRYRLRITDAEPGEFIA